MSILKKKETYEDYGEVKIKKGKDQTKMIKRIINIVFIVLVIIMVMISTDIILVARYNNSPIFAVKVKEYKDGGTKEYLGIGYKVIKYHQKQGRKDIEVGTWKLKYNIDPINLSSLDLAIEFRNDYKESYKKYGKKFIRTNGVVESINEKENTITIKYNDPDHKYDLEIICNMEKKDMIKVFSKYDEITLIGTVSNFKVKTKTSPNRLYLEHVFAEK